MVGNKGSRGDRSPEPPQSSPVLLTEGNAPYARPPLQSPRGTRSWSAPTPGWLGAGLLGGQPCFPPSVGVWLSGPRRNPSEQLWFLGLGSASPPLRPDPCPSLGSPGLSRGLETVAAAVTSLRTRAARALPPGKGRQLCLRPCQLLTVVSS